MHQLLCKQILSTSWNMSLHCWHIHAICNSWILISLILSARKWKIFELMTRSILKEHLSQCVLNTQKWIEWITKVEQRKFPLDLASNQITIENMITDQCLDKQFPKIIRIRFQKSWSLDEFSFYCILIINERNKFDEPF